MDQLIARLPQTMLEIVGRTTLTSLVSMSITALNTYDRSRRSRRESVGKGKRKEDSSSSEEEDFRESLLLLKSKLAIISPIADLIQMYNLRGNSTILQPIGQLVHELEKGMGGLNGLVERFKGRDEGKVHRRVCKEVDRLIKTCDTLLPALHLGIASLGLKNGETVLSTNISPSRLLQASHVMNQADVEYREKVWKRRRRGEIVVQVGPMFQCKLYRLFVGFGDGDAWRWKLQYPVGKVWLERRGLEKELQYVLKMERLKDGLYRDEEDEKGREVMIKSIQSFVYADSGQLLRLEDGEPVLVFKVVEGESVEWYALEAIGWEGGEESSSGEEENGESSEEESDEEREVKQEEPVDPLVHSQLAELEYLLRLAILECQEQQRHVDVGDELLGFYLGTTSGYGGKVEHGTPLGKQTPSRKSVLSAASTPNVDSPTRRLRRGESELLSVMGKLSLK